MYTKFIQSGNLVEIYEYEKSPTIKKGAVRKGKRRNRGPQAFVCRFDNLNRRRKAFVRLVRANFSGAEQSALFTLTMFEILHISRAYNEFTRFCKEIRRRFGKQIRYIGVPEFQARGAVHFHVLIWGLPVDKVNDERIYRYFQRIWARGFLDCINTNGSDAIAFYLAKYMSKSMQDKRLYNQHAYATSRNVLRPLSISSEILDAYKELVYPQKHSLIYSRQFDTMWLGRCNYKIYYKDYDHQESRVSAGS